MSDRAKRYRKLCADGARQLGVKPSDPRAQHYAAIHLARENLVASLIAGKTVDVGELSRIDELLRAIMPVAPSSTTEPMLRLQICSKKIHSVCERCGHIQPTNVDTPQPDHAKPKFKLPLLLPAPSDDGGDSNDD
jgi:hypothetical protein